VAEGSIPDKPGNLAQSARESLLAALAAPCDVPFGHRRLGTTSEVRAHEPQHQGKISMKRKSFVIGAMITSALAAASVAYAAVWVDPFYINDLRVYNGDSVYRVMPAATVKNPANCANSSYYEGLASISADSAQLMNKALMAAMLSGKRVKLSVAQGSCGPNNNPGYFRVIIEK
jgi:hypothetical protein